MQDPSSRGRATATRWAVVAIALLQLILGAEHARAISVLPHGSFESESNGQPDGWLLSALPLSGGSASAELDDRESTHGDTSARLRVTGPAAATLASDRIPIQPGVSYLLSFRYRAEGFSTDGSSQGVDAYATLDFEDATGRVLARAILSMPYGSRPWSPALRLVTPPDGSSRATLSVYLSAGPDSPASTVWIDDVRLRPWVTERVENAASWSFEIASGDYSSDYPDVADEDTDAKISVLANPIHHEPGGYLVNGISLDGFGPGAYRIELRAKIGANSAGPPVARLDANSDTAVNRRVAALELSPDAFAAAGHYEDVSMQTVMAGTGQLVPVVVWLGGNSLWIDRLRITPERLVDAAAFADLFVAPEIVQVAADPSARSENGLTSDGDRSRLADEVIPPTPPYDRQSLLAIIKEYRERVMDPRLAWLDDASPYNSVNELLATAEHFAFAHLTEGYAEDAIAARGFVDQAHRLMQVGAVGAARDPVFRLHRVWQWLEMRGALTELTRSQLAELLEALVPEFPADELTFGSWNRPLGRALQGEILLHYQPNANDAGQWRLYVERVWSQFWSDRDTNENSSHYNALSLRFLLDWLELRGTTRSVLSDPEMAALFERHLLQVLPLGSLPHYGDSYGWNVEWGHWIRIFERVASATGDGRYRWAAHRLFDYGRSHLEDLASWSETGSVAIDSLMLAAIEANDAISGIAPDADVVVLERTKVLPVPPGTSVAFGSYTLDASKRIPDKLVMRTSDSNAATAMLLELSPEAGHGPGTASSLTALVDRGSVLLMDQGYLERGPQHHNAVWIEDYEGVPLDSDAESTQVLDTASHGPLRFARMRIDRYRGYPAALERSVVLSTEGPALVVDTLHFSEDVEARVGPVFNFGAISDIVGDSWLNGYVGESIPVRGLGAGSPVLSRWHNPPRSLLVFFAPLEGATLEFRDRRPADPTSLLPMRAQYRWRGVARAGTSLSFATLLVPHSQTQHVWAASRVASFVSHSTRGSAARLGIDGIEAGDLWLSSGPIQSHTMITDASAAVAFSQRGELVSGALAGGNGLRIAGSRSELLADGRPAVAIRRINAGGNDVVDVLDGQWQSDARSAVGPVFSTGTPVEGAPHSILAQTERRAPPGTPALHYRFLVAAGSYTVRLHFGVIDSNADEPGERVVDVWLQQRPRYLGFDAAARVGRFESATLSLDVEVVTSELDLKIKRVVGDPAVSAIEILRHL